MENTEQIINLAGTKGKYQLALLILVFLSWSFASLPAISIPFIEQMPIVNYQDQKSGKVYSSVPLDYKICQNASSFLIVKKSGHSFVTEFGIECNKVKVTLLGTLTVLGLILGNFIYPFTSNLFGRKLSTILASLCYSTTVGLLCLSNDYYYGIAFLFISSIFGIVTVMSALTLLFEQVSKDVSSIFNAIAISGFAVGGIVFSFIFMQFDSWKITFGIDAVAMVLLNIVLFSFSEESPRFLLICENFDEFFNVLTKIALFNGNYEEFREKALIPYKTPECLSFFYENPDYTENAEEIDKINAQNLEREVFEAIQGMKRKKRLSRNVNKLGKKAFSVLSLLKYSSQRRVFLLLCLIWFYCGLTTYAMGFNIKNLKGNIYENASILCSIELLGNICSALVSNVKTLGRVMNFWIFLSLGLICILAVFAIPPRENMELVLSFFIKFCCTICFQLCFIYSAEIYPTVVRAAGLGTNAVFSKIGAIASPFVIEFFEPYLYHLLFVFNVASLICSLFLKETLGKSSGDEIPECSDFQAKEIVS